MSIRRGLLVPFVFALTTMGCAEVIDEANEHSACVLASEPEDAFMPDSEADPTMEFVADAPLWVRVEHGCRPCGRKFEMGCTVEVEGDEIIVESTFNYEDTRRPCDALCAIINSTCQTPGPVPAGSYTIVYGDRTRMLEVPSMSNAPCFPAL